MTTRASIHVGHMRGIRACRCAIWDADNNAAFRQEIRVALLSLVLARCLCRHHEDSCDCRSYAVDFNRKISCVAGPCISRSP